jgi:hypothetical protein
MNSQELFELKRTIKESVPIKEAIIEALSEVIAEAVAGALQRPCWKCGATPQIK